MKLQFTEAEINAGVRHAVGLMGFDLTGKDVQVEYSMGRKNNGLSAEVNIINPLIQPVTTKAEPVVIKGFTDTDPATEAKPLGEVFSTDALDASAATTETVTETPAATGADAAALFGDDD